MRVKIASVLWTVLLAAAPAFAQQGSLTLKDSDLELCHRNETAWSIGKTGALADGKVTWTVTVVKGAVSDDVLSGFGFVRILNSGTAGATLGNIVVNLQRRQGNKWVTASSDIANATQGDAAVKALLVAGASSEGKSCFEENAASGPLVFTDANSNSLFSLVPAFTLPPGQALDLLFHADFNNSILGIPAGELVRFEVIVTFGNAGARGGSGASASWIDINGSGALEPHEKYVRSVPCRLTRGVPVLEECAKTVTLTDTAADVVATGTVGVSGFFTDIGGGTGVQELSASGVFTTSVLVTPGALGGTVTNTASLDSPGDEITLEGPLDLLTGLPSYSYEVECCPGLHLRASSTVVILSLESPEDPPGHQEGDYLTYTQGGWGATPRGNNPASILAAHFAAVYPQGVEVGIPGAGGFSMKFTSAAAIGVYLPNGSDPSSLTADLVDPASSSAGVFGAQVLALRLNVDFSDADVPGFNPLLGHLFLHGTGTSLDGLSVSQILAVAETALGGGALPVDYDLSELSDLVTDLNEAFDNGTPTGWAETHLSEGT
ncbi:MAG TPA: hypothetical protein VF950_10035 [Planctomycetota bacterium]